MRIVIDMQGLQTPFSAHRGVGRYTENLVRELLKLDSPHEFYLAMNGAFPESALRLRLIFADLLPSDRIKVWNQSFDPAYIIAPPALVAAGEILRETFLNAIQPDIIFSTNLQEGMSDPACTSVHRLDYPVLYCTTLHDVVPLFQDEYLRDEKIKNWYLEKIAHAKASDILLTVSDSSKHDIVEKLGIKRDRVIVVENGYDSEHFNPDPITPDAAQQLRAELDLPESFILYYGGADLHKNLARLIQAYALITPPLRRDVALVLAGRDVAAQAELRNLITELDLSGRVLTPGFIKDQDLPSLIKSSKAFIFPSTHEGFGLPVLEAMACGVPVIGSGSSSVGEIIDNPDATFDPFDTKDMAARIESVIGDARLRTEIVRHSLQRVKAFSWRGSAEKLLNTFERHLASRAPRQVSSSDPVEDFIHYGGELAATLSEAQLAAVAESVAATFPRPRRNKLFLDISSVILHDHRSGIQRVTRAIARELLETPPEGVDVEVVYTSYKDLSFYAANTYVRANFDANVGRRDEFVEFLPGDTLIYLDLHPRAAIAHREVNIALRVKGVAVYHVVYDLIPVLHPETFWPELCNEFREWIETVSLSDGAICISQAVAAELSSYLSVFGEKRPDPFRIGWFHLGADLARSAPTTGMPENAAETLARLSVKPSFLMVGTLEPRKGHRQVLAAFEQLWASGVEVALIMVGRQGWLMEEFGAKLAAHPEFDERLVWIDGGSDEYLEAIYRASTCLIAASEAEGFGLPLIEAAQHQIPIIARDIPVFREIAGAHAFYFDDVLHPSAISEAVRKWLNLKANDQHPRSIDMAWLTWRQSAQQLVDVITRGDWAYRIDAKAALRPNSRQTHRSERIRWSGFSAAEVDRRWAGKGNASVGFNWVGPTHPAQLRMRCSALGAQRVGVSLNGASPSDCVLEGDDQSIAFDLPPLREGENVLEFSLPDGRRVDGADSRILSIAVHSLEIVAGLKEFEFDVDYLPNSSAIEWQGFSHAEEHFRWTDGGYAQAAFVLANPPRAARMALKVFALGDQRVQIWMNGESVFSDIVSSDPTIVDISVQNLTSGYNTLGFTLPDARSPGDADDRLLGLAIHHLRLEQAPPPNPVRSRWLRTA
jgi:glycosyltransferase involved in cell wall biosynthesis